MSGSLKEFEKWYDSNTTSCDPYTANKEGWKAALEWVLSDLKAAREGFDLGLYDTLKKELGEAEK